MNIILIRHGHPDYANDTLTPQGHEEARKLAASLENLHVDAIFQSPNGRAQHTCEYTARQKRIEPVTLEWLREVGIKRGDLYLWNAPGTLFLRDSPLPTYENCLEPDGAMPEGKPQFDKVSHGFDEVMASFGYIKQEHLYRAENLADKTVLFFCHHGVIATLLSYLLHWPLPLTFVHSCVDTTGVTRLTMEPHDGFAQPKLISFNCRAHLDAR
jgi:broad specificity phosphatase PhoE